SERFSRQPLRRLARTPTSDRAATWGWCTSSAMCSSRPVCTCRAAPIPTAPRTSRYPFATRRERKCLSGSGRAPGLGARRSFSPTSAPEPSSALARLSRSPCRNWLSQVECRRASSAIEAIVTRRWRVEEIIVRVLFLTHRLPYAPNRGDRIRAYHILRMLASRAEVELVSLVHD